MEALIAELERATEGSRSLNLKVGKVVGWHGSFTQSLDAARTLGSEDARWKVGDGKGGPYASAGGPRIYEAATPALSLCIAFLRDRQAMEEAG